MSSIFVPVLVRFTLGGAAVVAATLVARWWGGRIGGIFAAFPAVYISAILSLQLEYSGTELLHMSAQVSHGALVGMIADIVCAIAASRFILKRGWKKGLLMAILLWCLVAPGIYFSWLLI